MTIHQIPTPLPSPRHRSGEPWTDDDYEELLRLYREGTDLAELSRRLGRSQAVVQARAKRLLPLDQRGVPSDRVLPQLRRNLLQVDDYDWQTHLAATPPPRPVVNHVHPPAVRTGIEGLQDHELLAMALALAQLPAPPWEDDDPVRACANEVARRGLENRLTSQAVDAARERVASFLLRRFPGGTFYPEPPW